MTTVVDASCVVAALIDGGPDGSWAEEVLSSGPLAAPHLLLVESANVLRRAALAGDITHDVASLAHADLIRLRITLLEYDPLAERVWELRHNLSAYDAWYVATAEALGAPLATLDHCVMESPGPRCRFVTPPVRSTGTS